MPPPPAPPLAQALFHEYKIQRLVLLAHCPLLSYPYKASQEAQSVKIDLTKSTYLWKRLSIVMFQQSWIQIPNRDPTKNLKNGRILSYGFSKPQRFNFECLENLSKGLFV